MSRHETTWLRQWFGKAGLADEIFPLLRNYFQKEAVEERKKLRQEKPKKERVPLSRRFKPLGRAALTFVKSLPQKGRGLLQATVGLFCRVGGFFKGFLPALCRLPKTGKRFLRRIPNLAVHGFEQFQTARYRTGVRLRAAWPELRVLLQEKGVRTAVMLVLAAVALLTTAVFTFGYSVSVNGEEIGVVHAAEEVTAMQESVRRDFENLEMDQDIRLSFAFVPKSDLSNQKSLRQAFLETYDRTVDGAVIQVEGETRAVLPTEAEAYEVLKTLQDKYTEEGAKVTFDQPVEVLLKPVPLSMAVGVESAVELLEGRNTADSLYTVQPGDTFWSIAAAYHMSVDTLMAINGSKKEHINIGDTLTVKVPVPYLSVRATRDVVYTEEIPFTTRSIDDPDLYRGRSTVVTAGVPGQKEIEATVVKVNGIEVSRNILKETVLSQPVEKVVRVGTKTPPRTMATGSFVRPTGGYLTSRFGYRWGRNHHGIDIGASSGTPIYAADGGVITMSGWNGNYGKMVMINHENGYVTYYAHCSRLLYNSGKRVAKGDVIAYVGNTGRSTGPHLHFEIRKNGTPVNPLNYVSY